MYPTKNIIENAVNSKDHTTLVAAVKAAGLVDTLEGAGPFTVFAPTNEAFARLPAGTVDTLLKPENKGKLTTVLTYHVVPGRLDRRRHRRNDREGGGKAMLKTVEGGTSPSSATPAISGSSTPRATRPGHDPERDAVERRHPGHQQGVAAGLSAPPPRLLAATSGRFRAPAFSRRAACGSVGCAPGARHSRVAA